MFVPTEPKIYHIVHVDRLPSIIKDGALLYDAEIMRRGSPGTTIGLNSIEQRRLKELTLSSHPNLHVGDCVPDRDYDRPALVSLSSLKEQECAGRF